MSPLNPVIYPFGHHVRVRAAPTSVPHTGTPIISALSSLAQRRISFLLARIVAIIMPSRMAAQVVTVDAAKMHKIDTRNVENLFSMWTGKTPLLTPHSDRRLMNPLLQCSPDVPNPWKRVDG